VGSNPARSTTFGTTIQFITMTFNEAYDAVMEELRKLLVNDGITSKLKPTGHIKASDKGTLDRDKWVNVHIPSVTGSQLNKVFDAEMRLDDKGITFDTGFFGLGGRDWEIDFSLTVKQPEQTPSGGN
jgi:hypothetical protein